MKKMIAFHLGGGEGGREDGPRRGTAARQLPAQSRALVPRVGRGAVRQDRRRAEHDAPPEHVRLPLDMTADALRLTMSETHGADTVRLYRFEVD